MAEVSKSATGDENLKAAACYFPIMLIGPLVALFLFFTEKENKFLRFHALQSLIFMVAVVVVFFALWFVTLIVAIIPIVQILAIVMLPILLIVGLAVFIADLFLMYKAYLGEKFMLPVLGAFAEKSA